MSESSLAALRGQIAGLLGQQGQIAADRQRQNAQIWGSTIANIGQYVGQLPMQIIEAKKADMQQQIQQQQLDSLKKAQAGQQAANQIIASLPRNTDGTYDTGALMQKLAAGNVPLDMQEKFATTLDNINKVTASFAQSQKNHAADIANAILTVHGKDQPVTMESAQTGMAAAKAAGIASDADEQKFTQMLAQGADPEKVLKTIRGLGDKYKPDYQALPANSPGVLNKTTGEVAPTGVTKPKPDYTIGNQRFSGETNQPIATGEAKPTNERPMWVMRNGKAVAFKPSEYQYQQGDVPYKPPSVTVGAQNQAARDVKESVKGMKDGTIPPQLPGRASKEYTAMMAEAHRQGFDLAGAATDWVATQKHIATLNGAQQLRLNQSINQLPELLDSVDGLASKWKAGRFPILNKANLALAKGGAFGKDAASIANQLDAQIADVTADLGNVYMGGNSPTDEALNLAKKALDANWDEKVLHDMVGLARQNVQTRKNSIRNTGVQGASENNPYAPKPEVAPPTGRYNPKTGKIE